MLLAVEVAGCCAASLRRAVHLQQESPARRQSVVAGTSQTQHQVADGGRPGQERVVAGVELHDGACTTGELALELGGGALVLRAYKVRRSHLLPGRRLHRLLVRDDWTARPALPAHVQPAARHLGRTALARLPAHRDHRRPPESRPLSSLTAGWWPRSSPTAGSSLLLSSIRSPSGTDPPRRRDARAQLHRHPRDRRRSRPTAGGADQEFILLSHRVRRPVR